MLLSLPSSVIHSHPSTLCYVVLTTTIPSLLSSCCAHHLLLITVVSQWHLPCMLHRRGYGGDCPGSWCSHSYLYPHSCHPCPHPCHPYPHPWHWHWHPHPCPRHLCRGCPCCHCPHPHPHHPCVPISVVLIPIPVMIVPVPVLLVPVPIPIPIVPILIVPVPLITVVICWGLGLSLSCSCGGVAIIILISNLTKNLTSDLLIWNFRKVLTSSDIRKISEIQNFSEAHNLSQNFSEVQIFGQTIFRCSDFLSSCWCCKWCWCRCHWTHGCIVNTGGKSSGSILDAKGAAGGHGQWWINELVLLTLWYSTKLPRMGLKENQSVVITATSTLCCLPFTITHNEDFCHHY